MTYIEVKKCFRKVPFNHPSILDLKNDNSIKEIIEK